jgi:Protein CHAPERONE-LIKE PROTEIN OF POR1-like
MSNQSDYETLGVTASASFEDIQSARAKLAREHAADAPRLQSIEKAYDAVLMERLRLRQEGKIDVPDGVRFAENKVVAPKTPAKPAIAMPPWMLQITDRPVGLWDWLAPTVTYMALVGLSIGFAVNLSNVQTLLGIGTGAAIFFVYRKQNRILWAILFGFVGLILGYTLGLPIARLLVTQVPSLPNFQVVAAWVTFVILWLASVFLK